MALLVLSLSKGITTLLLQPCCEGPEEGCKRSGGSAVVAGFGARLLELCWHGCVLQVMGNSSVELAGPGRI
jgi:hypothetical protein